MAWTSVHTFAVGDVLGAADLNTWLTANTSFLFQPPSCRVVHNITQNIASGSTPVVLIWTTEVWKRTDSGMHSNASNTSRMIAVTPGVYTVWGGNAWAVSSAGNYRQLRLVLNATPTVYQAVTTVQPSAVHASEVSVATVWAMVVNDFFEVYVLQDSGGSLAASTNAANSGLAMAWIGN